MTSETQQLMLRSHHARSPRGQASIAIARYTLGVAIVALVVSLIAVFK